jgi:hypothetical protein
MPDDNTFDTRPMAIAALSIAQALTATLVRKGLLSREEVNDLFEGILVSLEGSQAPNDPDVPAARVLIDGLAQIIATGRPPLSKPSPYGSESLS